ncbi:MAG: hypothetical protein H7Z72_16300 [Bacteroidetes bacterium]|nr:hypothetical protein [Fibrella sp.]
MTPVSDLHAEIHEVVYRIERLNNLIALHEQQSEPDTLATDGYKRLKKQYAAQLESLLSDLNIDVAVHSKAA